MIYCGGVTAVTATVSHRNEYQSNSGRTKGSSIVGGLEQVKIQTERGFTDRFSKDELHNDVNRVHT